MSSASLKQFPPEGSRVEGLQGIDLMTSISIVETTCLSIHVSMYIHMCMFESTATYLHIYIYITT